MKSFPPLAIALILLVAAPLPSPAQASANDAGIHASRVILRVRDLATSITFYRDQVGLKLQSINDEFATFDAGGMTLMLEGLAQPPTAPSTGLAAFTEIALESADIFATYASLRDRGVTFRSAPHVVTTDGLRDLYAADFRDPSDHVISISGWVVRRAAVR